MEPLYHKNDGLNGVLYLVRDGALVDSLIGVSNYGKLIFSKLNSYVLMEVPERGGSSFERNRMYLLDTSGSEINVLHSFLSLEKLTDLFIEEVYFDSTVNKISGEQLYTENYNFTGIDTVIKVDSVF